MNFSQSEDEYFMCVSWMMESREPTAVRSI